MTLPNERLNRWLLPVSLATTLGMGTLMLGVLFATSTFHPAALSLADSVDLSAPAPAFSPRLGFLEASPTPANGNICVMVFFDANQDRQLNAGEYGLADALITVTNASGVVVTTYTTTGDEVPYYSCIAYVPVGIYTVTEKNPPCCPISTTPDEVTVTVPASGNVTVSYGDWSRLPTATPTATSTPLASPTASSTPTPTSTPTGLPTSTVTATPTPLPTDTPTPSPTSTATPATPLPTPTSTATSTPIPTSTSIPTATATSTAMPTATATPLGTITPTPLCPGVFGYVFVDLSCNGVRDYTDPGLAGAVVTLRHGYDGPIVGSRTTASDGFFLMYAPALGDYVLCEDAPPGYRASTPECWGISLHDCRMMFMSFGECPPYRLYLPLVLRRW